MNAVFLGSSEISTEYFYCYCYMYALLCKQNSLILKYKIDLLKFSKIENLEVI